MVKGGARTKNCYVIINSFRIEKTFFVFFIHQVKLRMPGLISMCLKGDIIFQKRIYIMHPSYILDLNIVI